jgi:TonB family protein
MHGIPRRDERTMTKPEVNTAPLNAIRSGRRASMKNPSLWLLICFSIVSISFARPSRAQLDSKSDRKVATRVEPDYPPVLRMRQIGGTVRLEVTITPQGTVERAKVLGGNPILAESAVTAVKKWRYVSAENTTTTTVSLVFNPYQ